ncbi:Asp-tRNA(Asn)/Glu-tRNA(Gln) amidotransferase subunit GatB [Candidatus Dependentiae bacterium]
MTRPTSIIDNYPEYEATIGIEVHVQLTTKSKMFCASARQVSEQANIHICNVCTGAPGALPVVNRQAVDYAILAGLATNCTIAKESTFDRKHYFYPDLPKDYQITQQFKPICLSGSVEIRLEDGSRKTIRLNRIHMEEDAGKNLHSGSSNESFVDLNRAGTPLLEVVSEPDIKNAQEAKTYLKTLRSIVQYIGICTGNMEEGAFRADTNISVKRKDTDVLGTRVELKNINSFKFISDAIEYELGRQLELIEEGGSVKQETRLWDTKNQMSVPMRSKEEAADYRFFNDPDLPIIRTDDAWVERMRAQLPELPDQKFERLTKQSGLSEYEADILVEDIELGNYFDAAHKISTSKQVINLILRDLLGHLKEHNITLADCKVTPEKLAAIGELVESGVINNRAAKEVFEQVAQTGKDPQLVVKEKGLEQIGSTDELEAIVKQIIADNPANVEQYKQAPDDRKQRLSGFFVGQAMKKTQGKGNPKILQELLKKHLG